MGANWVIADDLTITGSIGVIMQTLNYKDLFGKIGLKSVVFKSGRFKDILNGGRDATPEEVELVQALIMETYEQFLSVVATERKLDPQQLRNNLADGRIFSGRQALAVKLVDQTGNFQDAVKKASQMAKVSDAEVFDYTVPFSLKNLVGLFAKSQTPRIAIEPLPASLKLQQGKLYYLSLHLF
jgi:protease-4